MKNESKTKPRWIVTVKNDVKQEELNAFNKRISEFSKKTDGIFRTNADMVITDIRTGKQIYPAKVESLIKKITILERIKRFLKIMRLR